MARVSILTPAHNEAKFIGETIESVQRQVLEDWEMMIVDDGSDDETVSIAQRFARNDGRITVITGPKQGKVGCFNQAYARCAGELIVLLGADDVLPDNSLENRSQLMVGSEHAKSVGYGRLQTFSDMKKHDGIVIPKKMKGNRSGGTLVLTRNLANEVFPIPDILVAEDIWLGTLANQLAEIVIEDPTVVLKYRIHVGNSNPRHLGFSDMTESLHKRLLPYELILRDSRYHLSSRERELLIGKMKLEEARYGRRLARLLSTRDVSWIDKARALSSSHPSLYALRRRFFRLFSGWG